MTFVLFALAIFLLQTYRMNYLHHYYQQLQSDDLNSILNGEQIFHSAEDKLGQMEFQDNDGSITSLLQDGNDHNSHSSNNNNALLKNSSITNYTWVGNQWIPPKGVPTYSPTELLEYFSTRNVLFIGDSTSRRVWATAYALMNATDRTNIPRNDLDSHAVVDFHKRTKPPFRQCQLDDRGARKESQRLQKIIFDQYECRDLPGLNSYSTGKNSTSVQIDKKGRFDFTYFTCYSQVAWLVRPDEDNIIFNKHIKPYYDLIIVGLGIWEIVEPEKCDNNSPKDPHKNRLNRLLEHLKKQSSGELQIFYRSCGFDARESLRSHQRTRDFDEVVDNFFSFENSVENQEKKSNLTLIDWADPISKRSFGENRIKGDLPPHYGPEARTLFIQQVMHQLKKTELQ